MSQAPSPQQWPRGPLNLLHRAAILGATEDTGGLLASGHFDINEGDLTGVTPLMFAACSGHLRVARILLNNGASVSVVGDDGGTALGLAAKFGHLAVTKMLMIEAGADLEATAYGGYTPLHMSAAEGHLDVMRALIKAGANPNNRALDGSTPLSTSAAGGCVEAVKMLLRARANPLLAKIGPNLAGINLVPLDIAAELGHTEVVRELIQHVGIEGCGSASYGVIALLMASRKQRVDVMAILTDGGLVDTGKTLSMAAQSGLEASVKFLLQQQLPKQQGTTIGDRAYVDYCDDEFSPTPLLFSIGLTGSSPPSPRIVRMLVDAGADTTSTIRVHVDGRVVLNDTPLALTTRTLHEKKIQGNDATEEQLRRLEAIRRLLLQVEAVHAVSWLWPTDVPTIAHAVEGTRRAQTASTPLISMLPIMRRRTRRRGVLLTALFKYSRKA